MGNEPARQVVDLGVRRAEWELTQARSWVASCRGSGLGHQGMAPVRAGVCFMMFPFPKGPGDLEGSRCRAGITAVLHTQEGICHTLVVALKVLPLTLFVGI